MIKRHLLETFPPMMASHRGYSNDNTIRGIVAAINRGIKIIEVDVAATKENVIVLHHDSQVTGGVNCRIYRILN